MKSATLSLLMLALLAIVLPSYLPPAAQAALPTAVKTFSGSLTSANPNVTQPWQSRDFPDPGFLFHYAITGGSQPDDVVYVYIEGTIDSWDLNWPLMGEGWTYCSPYSFEPCPFDAGLYNVTAQAGPAARLPISYSIGFYLVPNPPVDFSGHIPANSTVRRSIFGVLLPSAATNSKIVLGVTSGSYQFFVDNKNGTVVNRNTQLSLNLTKGFHLLEVDAETEGIGEDVAWSVQVSGPPKLDVRIVDTCPTLNPKSGQSTCVTHAEATASSGTPTVSYQWTASGGKLNSTAGQWITWTAPPGVAAYTLTVNASAPGYVSGTDSLTVQVTPEFPTATLPFLGAVLLASLLVIRRFGNKPAGSIVTSDSGTSKRVTIRD
jgi:hypothetical protein